MAFTIILQKNNSERNRVTKNISDLLTVSGTLKNECSIIDPVILIEGNLANLTECNYCTIETFNRQYFVTDIKSIRNNLIEISCHCDVLTTYASSIKTNTGIIKRQSQIFNRNLDDNSFQIYNDPIIQTLEFPNSMTDNRFILAIAGR